RMPRIRIGGPQGALIGIALVITIVAVVLASVPIGARDVQGYTSLSLVPTTGATGPQVEIGIRSNELVSRDYRLTIARGTQVLYVDRSIVLSPGGSWHAALTPQPSSATSGAQITARLTWNDGATTRVRMAQMSLRP
ncbi:MAG TPA: hypothetical protein VFR41_00015, partial [Acidimicrobiia bacterium]|nr:hypothetical protein [Acidimicrobiia bacterium]